ncbi:MAG: 1-acyl-sn-glycerol-3-phosphate acyltransferase [Oscillospiraceae bacterium]|nr:1-acyl-sn-glycerol-3-phosphate acyltransferase [Oscillospiraceae bacterium]
MLLFVLLILSAGAAAGLCFATDAYNSLQYLWQLPVFFVGAFLVLTVLALLFLLLVTLPVDPDKEREKDSRFFRFLAKIYVEFVLTVLPVRLHVTGKEKMPKDGRVLLVSNHLHEIDPAIFLHVFPKKQFTFVAKRETRDMFFVNKFMPMLLCPLVNRENDREALKAILRSIKLLKDDIVSVGIFPEGGICKQRKLQHLKPGVFKIAQKANVPIVVCTLQNTHNVLTDLLHFKSTYIHMHLLEVLPAEEVVAANTVDIAHKVYDLMAADLGPENVLEYPEENA